MCGPGRRGLGGLVDRSRPLARPALRQHLPAGLFGKLSDVGVNVMVGVLATRHLGALPLQARSLLFRDRLGARCLF